MAQVSLHTALVLELDELDIGLVHCDNEYDGKALLLHNLSPTWYPSVPPLPPKPDDLSATDRIPALTERASSLLSTDAEKYVSC